MWLRGSVESDGDVWCMAQCASKGQCGQQRHGKCGSHYKLTSIWSHYRRQKPSSCEIRVRQRILLMALFEHVCFTVASAWALISLLLYQVMQDLSDNKGPRRNRLSLLLVTALQLTNKTLPPRRILLDPPIRKLSIHPTKHVTIANDLVCLLPLIMSTPLFPQQKRRRIAAEDNHLISRPHVRRTQSNIPFLRPEQAPLS